jgi:sulfate transport system ATP-binding protein
MELLGQVNVFQGRVQAGKAMAGPLCVDYPAYNGADERPAKVYLRPHEFEIRRIANGTPSVPATVLRIHAAGPLARVSLQSAEGSTLRVELTLEELRALGLHEQDSVHLVPKQARVFLHGESADGQDADAYHAISSVENF